MNFPVLLLLFLSFPIYAMEYKCGEMRKIKQPYGNVELRVNCDLTATRIWVAEFKGDTIHGVSIGFNKKGGWKDDSSFYVNDKKHGTAMIWDSLGNVVGREHFRNGIQVGKREHYFAPGRPAMIKHYNDSGKENGSWQEWWPNGNKKFVGEAKNGQLLHSKAYYPNGKLRYKEKVSYQPDPAKRSAFTGLISRDTFDPQGKPAGNVRNGMGESYLFPEEPDSTGEQIIFHETYKGGILVKARQLSPEEAKKLLK